MVVGVCTLELEIPAAHSLKDKRSILKPIVAHVQKNFNVSIAEVDSQDAWQRATFGIVCVSANAEYAQGLLAQVVKSIDRRRVDAVVADYSIEIW